MAVLGFGRGFGWFAVLAVATVACTDFEKEAKATAAAKAAAADGGGSLGEGVGAADTDTVVADLQPDVPPDVPPDVAPDVGPETVDAADTPDAPAELPCPATCDDNKTCTDDACTDGKCVSTPKSGNCDDGNACTEGDKCAAGSCVAGAAKACDDKNACTKDSCDPKQDCQFANTTDACDDGSKCTDKDACKDGNCTGAGVVCDDNNPCTDDSCDKVAGCKLANNATPCDDGSACTTADACKDGKCIAGAPKDCDDKEKCTDDSCDAAKGCVNAPNSATCTDGNACAYAGQCQAGKCQPEQKKSCDDGSPCTKDDTCDIKLGCQPAPVDNVDCNDGNQCTVGDKCAAGKCAAGKAVPPIDDKNPCTDDVCDSKLGFVNEPNTAACSDGDACTTGEKCFKGVCGSGTPVVCDDKNACTLDTCDPKAGCANKPNLGDLCDDGDKCTAGDKCDGAGKCGGGPAMCDDGNPCTNDGCDKAKGCTVTDNKAACDDANKCTEADQCAAGACKGGAQKNCDDNEVCTKDACLPTTGCDYTNVVGSCSDSNKCTEPDACANGKCKAGSAVVCDDGSPCTTDSCDPAKGCAKSDNTAACDDGNACTHNDTCSVGACKGAAVNCDDKTPCTTDSCDKLKGCVNAAVSDGAVCDDNNDCTAGDGCKAGKCTGTGKSCDDGKPCTKDGCSNNVCSNVIDTSLPCTDSNECTTGDTCSANGTCTSAGKKTCVDGNVCTTNDVCLPATGCDYPFNTAACNDNDACTTIDLCTQGACKGGAQLVCDDNNPCTTDTCDKASGCKFANASDGAVCDDGSKCTDPDKCTAGKCGGAVVVCDDKNGCTKDSCDPAAGCKFSNEDGPCDDMDKCTSADKCKGGICAGPVLVNCDDGNSCTKDACAPLTGCASTANDAALCEDGDQCTTGDKCANKACVAGAQTPCDDKNPCTADNCDSLTGKCVFADLPQSGSEGKDPDGADNDCDKLVDEEFDLDHDSVYCKGAVCQTNEADACPTVWTPDNAKEPCAGLGAGWTASKDVVLTEPGEQDGLSKARRTHEVVEVAVGNGALDGSLLALWRMDGGVGTDAGPFKNDATMGGVAKVAGAWGDADGAVTATPGPFAHKNFGALAPVGAGAVTLMAWVKPAAYSGSYHVVAGFGPAKIFMLYVSGDNAGVWTYTASGVFKVGTGGAVPLNAWSHMAATYQAGQLSFYLNGKLAGSAAGSVVAADTTLAVGSWPSGGDKLDGAVDEVAVFNRALSATEVAANVQSGKPYGTAFITGAQADLDDLRVTEATPYQGEHLVPHEVIGVRPFSDTDASKVFGWWAVNGKPDDAGPKKLASTFIGTTGAAPNRYGSTGTEFKKGAIEVDAALSLAAGKPFAIEAWVNCMSSATDCWVASQEQSNALRFSIAGTGKIFFEAAGITSSFESPLLGLKFSGWHHVGLNYTGSKLEAYVDGVQVASQVGSGGPFNPQGYKLAIGGRRPAETTIDQHMEGQLSDVVIHLESKPADYFYKRANPGIPTVRFLASTKPLAESGKYPFYKYAIKSGNAAAGALLPVVKALDKTTTCNALLSPCFGYVGWWPFDGGVGDASSNAHKTTGTATKFAAGAPGVALLAPPQLQVVGVAPLSAFTVEALVMPTAVVSTQNNWAVVQPHPADGDDWGLGARLGKVGLYYTNGASKVDLLGTTDVLTGKWQALAASYDLSTARVFADAKEVGSLKTAVVPGPKIGSTLLGADSDGLQGSLDNIRIMNRALTPDELLHHPLATWKITTSAADPCAGKSCDDTNPCTTDTCSAGTCSNTAVADGTPCGTGLSCTTGTCKAPSGIIGPWATTTALPEKTTGLWAAASKGYLYAIGGQTDTAAQSGKVWFAPIASDGKVGAWQSTAAFSPARDGFSIAQDGETLYVLPGSLGNNNSTTNVSLTTLQAAGGAAPFAATKDLPAFADLAGSVATGGYVYITGGAFASYYSTVWVGTQATNKTVTAWTQSTALPSARGQHRAFAHGGYVFVAGGYASGTTYQDVYAAQVQSGGGLGAWSATQPLPAKRYNFGLASQGAVQYAIGGADASGSAVADTASTAALAGGKTDPWKAQTALPQPLAGCGVAWHGARLYVIGGSNAGGKQSSVYFATAQ